MKVYKFIKNASLFIVNLCIFAIIKDCLIDLSYEMDNNFIWWIGIIFLIVWYGCACWEDA